MKILVLTVFLLLVLSWQTSDAKRRRGKCRAAVYAIPRPSNGKILVCCRFKRIKFVCNAGYKLTDGDEEVRCKKGRIYGTFPKCTLAHKQTCGIAGYSPLKARIVGGSNANPGDWPWMAAIYRDDNFLCGGALITASYVLTAAHCFYNYIGKVDTPGRYQIWLGRTKLNQDEDSQKQFSEAEKIYVHNDFSLMTFKNDIAIIKLKTPVKFTKFVQPLCLPSQDESKRKTISYVAGWGSTKKQSKYVRITKTANNLKYVLLPIAEDSNCHKAATKTEPYDQETMFCAGDGKGARDACFGDSGGPLVVYEKMRTADNAVFYKWTVAGIVSWGEGCAQEKKYGFYTRVFKYRNWIRNIVGDVN